jgi:YVTN family beta-propeller protein
MGRAVAAAALLLAGLAPLARAAPALAASPDPAPAASAPAAPALAVAFEGFSVPWPTGDGWALQDEPARNVPTLLNWMRGVRGASEASLAWARLFLPPPGPGADPTAPIAGRLRDSYHSGRYRLRDFQGRRQTHRDRPCYAYTAGAEERFVPDLPGKRLVLRIAGLACPLAGLPGQWVDVAYAQRGLPGEVFPMDAAGRAFLAGLDFAKPRVNVRREPLDTSARLVAFGLGSLWVADPAAPVLVRLRPGSLKREATISLSARPDALAVGSDAAWAVGRKSSRLLRIDPKRNQQVAVIPIEGEPVRVDTGPGTVWITVQDDRRVFRLETASNLVTAWVNLGSFAPALLAQQDALWAARYRDDSVARLDPVSRKELAVVPVGHGPLSLAWGRGMVWVANSGEHTVSRIDPATNTEAARIPVRSPERLAFAAERLWVLSGHARTLVRLDPATGHMQGRPIALPGEPVSLTAGEDEVWVGLADGTLLRVAP